MARISLLFTLALVLAIGSVSANRPSHKKTQKNLCPPTLAGLQTFPSHEISKLIEKKVESAPKTIQFNALFAICKSYNDYLAGLKFAAVNNVFGLVHTKSALMSQAMLAAQASVGIQGHLAATLGKSYNAMAEGYVELVEMIAEISAKYKFVANAQISKPDRAKVEKCLIKLKGAVSVFLKVVAKCSDKFSADKQIALPVLPVQGAGFFGSIIENGVGFGGKLIGLGGHGQAGAGAGIGGNAGAGVGGKAVAGGKAGAGFAVSGKPGFAVSGKAGVGGKAGAGVGGKAGVEFGVGGKAGAGLGGKAGAKIGAHAGVKLGAKVGAHAGGKIGAKVGGQGEAKVGGLLGGVLGLGGKAQYDAAGKAKIGGGSGFRPLSHLREKHLN